MKIENFSKLLFGVSSGDKGLRKKENANLVLDYWVLYTKNALATEKLSKMDFALFLSSQLKCFFFLFVFFFFFFKGKELKITKKVIDS